MRIPLWEAKSKPEKFQHLWWTKKAESRCIEKEKSSFHFTDVTPQGSTTLWEESSVLDFSQGEEWQQSVPPVFPNHLAYCPRGPFLSCPTQNTEGIDMAEKSQDH